MWEGLGFWVIDQEGKVGVRKFAVNYCYAGDVSFFNSVICWFR